ncbi:MAG: hypothetical protein HC824_09690 [Synechococcales cyanobacterium RM1_1_8]|nr:hypothetical protein [Synechococcales cyanobacterium RM1_1_8]
MSYSQFTLLQVKEDFQLQTIEGEVFFPADVEPIPPSPRLLGILDDLPWAIAVGTDKARSEVLINPVLLEVRRRLQQRISVFSGEEFNVDASLGLNGICDFLISGSSEQLAVEAPAIVIVEAKKADLNSGIGQCIAEMVAAQRFNAAKKRPISQIYGCITSGTQWRFLKLQGQIVTIDLTEYPLSPIAQLLGYLVWMSAQALAKSAPEEV